MTPLKRGRGKKVVSENIAELHGGKTYAKTEKKFGKAKADEQAIAIALDQARKSGANIPKEPMKKPMMKPPMPMPEMPMKKMAVKKVPKKKKKV